MEMNSSIKLANCYFFRLMLFIQKLQVSFGVIHPGDKSNITSPNRSGFYCWWSLKCLCLNSAHPLHEPLITEHTSVTEATKLFTTISTLRWLSISMQAQPVLPYAALLSWAEWDNREYENRLTVYLAVLRIKKPSQESREGMNVHICRGCYLVCQRHLSPT